jgi:hypothetical protein
VQELTKIKEKQQPVFWEQHTTATIVILVGIIIFVGMQAFFRTNTPTPSISPTVTKAPTPTVATIAPTSRVSITPGISIVPTKITSTSLIKRWVEHDDLFEIMHDQKSPPDRFSNPGELLRYSSPSQKVSFSYYTDLTGEKLQVKRTEKEICLFFNENECISILTTHQKKPSQSFKEAVIEQFLAAYKGRDTKKCFLIEGQPSKEFGIIIMHYLTNEQIKLLQSEAEINNCPPQVNGVDSSYFFYSTNSDEVNFGLMKTYNNEGPVFISSEHIDLLEDYKNRPVLIDFEFLRNSP